MKEKFQEIAQQQGLGFSYGRKDYINLLDDNSFNEFKFHFLIDPIIKRVDRNLDTGSIDKIRHKGRYMIVQKSKLNEMYDNQLGVSDDLGKYNLYIQPVKDIQEKIEDIFHFDNVFSIVFTEEVETVNTLSENVDGIVVEFEILEQPC